MHGAAPLCFVLQAAMIDYLLVRRFSNVCWVFAVLEVPLLLHMLGGCHVREAVTNASFHWIVYTWFLASKVGVVYFGVLQHPDTTDVLSKVLACCLYVSPVFYTLLMLRSLSHVFDMKARSSTKEGTSDKMLTLEMVLIQDMLWHVNFDLLDLCAMLMYANGELFTSLQITNWNLLTMYPSQLANIQLVVGLFLVLGVFFHQQSFPMVSLAKAQILRKVRPQVMKEVGKSLLEGSTRRSSDASDDSDLSSEFPSGVLAGFSARNNALHAQKTATAAVLLHDDVSEGPTVDVVKARKRSAIVSIILVDLPFLITRLVILLLAIAAERKQEQDRVHDRDHAEIDPWLVKNLVCLPLQAMMIQFMQQADVEQSQHVQSSDVRRHEAKAFRKYEWNRRNTENRELGLAQVWEAIDEAELSSVDDQSSSDGNGQMSSDVLRASNWTAAPVFGKTNAERSAASAAQMLTTNEGMQNGCAWLKALFYNNCMFYMVVGLIAGWMVGRTDFAQAEHALLVQTPKR